MTKKTVFAASVFAWLVSTPAFAAVDFQCMSDCSARYSYGYCQSYCSYNTGTGVFDKPTFNQAPPPPQAPPAQGYLPPMQVPSNTNVIPLPMQPYR
jgi:hypothetical protein